jgi:hypothetical protein
MRSQLSRGKEGHAATRIIQTSIFNCQINSCLMIESFICCRFGSFKKVIWWIPFVAFCLFKQIDFSGKKSMVVFQPQMLSECTIFHLFVNKIYPPTAFGTIRVGMYESVHIFYSAICILVAYIVAQCWCKYLLLSYGWKTTIQFL